MATVFIEKGALTAAANLLRSMGATQVFVFCSATKGGLRPDSDIDTAVVAKLQTSLAGPSIWWIWAILRPVSGIFSTAGS